MPCASSLAAVAGNGKEKLLPDVRVRRMSVQHLDENLDLPQ